MKFLSNRSTKPASKSVFNAACTAMACCIVASAATAEPFTYQGQLTENNQPANGLYDMTFRLTDAAVGGFALAVDSVANVSVVDGLFTVEIDFPSSQLNSSNRWMSITVDGTILSPRVRLRDTPRAQNAVRANTAGTIELPFTGLSGARTAVSVQTSSASSNSSGLFGLISSASPGSFSAGVRGENNGTGFNGVGVYGSQNGFGYGMYGTTPGGVGIFGDSDAGFGLWGQSDVNTGLYARTNSGDQAVQAEHRNADTEAFLATDEYAIEAYNHETDGIGTAIFARGGNTGVYGLVESEDSSSELTALVGVAGNPTSHAIRTHGVYGFARASADISGRTAYGLFGIAATGRESNLAYGIYATAIGPGPGKLAAYLDGDVFIGGELSKTSGSFKIDHPLDPENKYLSHSFVESPDMMNIYNGVVTLNADGAGVIELPDYFETLNRDFRYQLTAMGTPMPNLYISEEISANQFSIAGGAAGARVSWEVTGIRQDPSAITHPIVVEKDKLDQHKGKYLDPEAYGLGDEYAIHPKPIKN